MEDGGWRMEDGGWRIEDGGWRRWHKRGEVIFAPPPTLFATVLAATLTGGEDVVRL
jgi:hypothetical protein